MDEGRTVFGVGHQDRTRQLELLVDSVVDYAIFLLDPTGVILSWNAGAQRIKGYRAEEIIGQHFSRFYTREDLDRDHPAEELKIARREGRFEEEGWRLRKDGSRFWANVVITCLRGADGEVVGFGKVTRDLTSRRLNEEQLRNSAVELRAAHTELEQFRRLVAAVQDYAIFMLDPSGHIATWNAGARHIKGYDEGEVLGRHFSIFYTDEAKAINHPAHELEVAARTGRYEEEGWRVRKDGSTFWAGVVITAVRDERGILNGFAKVTRDLTDRRAAEQELQRAREELERSNADLESFAGVAAHDLREPLRTIAGFSELVLHRHGDALPDDARRHLGLIDESVRRMDRMVARLLEFSRAGRDAAAPETSVALARSVERVLASLDGAVREAGAHVTVDVPDEAVALANAEDIDRVLQNLVANALKFGGRDGAPPAVHLRAGREGDRWRVEVADEGPGIPPEFQERIFEAFARLDAGGEQPGVGLGLAICRRILERHEGALGLESQPGAGACFWFSLPAAGA